MPDACHRWHVRCFRDIKGEDRNTREFRICICFICVKGYLLEGQIYFSKDLPNMNTFCDWLFETIVISVYDSFFRNYISIVLLSFIVCSGQSQRLFILVGGDPSILLLNCPLDVQYNNFEWRQVQYVLWVSTNIFFILSKIANFKVRSFERKSFKKGHTWHY